MLFTACFYHVLFWRYLNMTSMVSFFVRHFASISKFEWFEQPCKVIPVMGHNVIRHSCIRWKWPFFGKKNITQNGKKVLNSAKTYDSLIKWKVLKAYILIYLCIYVIFFSFWAWPMQISFLTRSWGQKYKFLEVIPFFLELLDCNTIY